MRAPDPSLRESLKRIASRVKKLPLRVKQGLVGLCLLIVALLIYPFQSTVVPLWRLHVIDNRGASVQRIRVTQHWRHNSLETEGHEEVQVTDEEGIVVFPQRFIRANLISRSLSTPLKLLRNGFNAKTGPYASVVVWGSKENETNVAIYEPGGPPQSEIIAARIVR